MKEIWNKIHSNYQKQDWVNKPSIFAEQTISYFPKNAKVLELGGALGQDSVFFQENGCQVLLTDWSEEVLAEAKAKNKVDTQQVDISKPLNFENSAFDVVYAHLSLHYFDSETTHKVFSEIHRILKPGGLLVALFNSVSDPECGTGIKIEEGFYEIESIKKRYFDTEMVKRFSISFEIIILDDKGETYKDNAKGVRGLIRFVGRKTGN